MKSQSLVLADRYELLERLGSGSTAEVHRARDRRTERLVAVKFLTEQSSSIPQAKERFRQEAEILARVKSPYVVPVLDFGSTGGRPYLVMELVEADDLSVRLAERGPFPRAEALRISRDTARGLLALHAEGVVHRDLKPANVLLEADDTPRIADLGLALHRGDSSIRTRTGVVMGTPGFMAPEVLQGGRAGPPADLYALGVLIYTLHTARIPFEGEDAGEVMKSQLRGVRRSTMTGLSISTAALVLELTELEPADRPGLEEVLRTLEREPGSLDSARPTRVIDSTLRVPAEPDAESRRRPPFLALLGLSACLGLATWWWSRGPGPVPPSSPAELPVAELVGDLRAVDLRRVLQDLLGSDEPERLVEVLKQRNRGEAAGREQREKLARYVRERDWFKSYRRLARELPASWWSAPPAEAAEARSHWALRRRAGRRLAGLRLLEILGDSLGRGEPILPGLEALLAPAIRVADRRDLPDRPQTIPGNRPLLEGCQVFSVRPAAASRLAGTMIAMIDPPSCRDRRTGVVRELKLPVPGPPPGKGTPLVLLLGYFSSAPWNFLEVALLDGEGDLLASVPISFDGRLVFRRFQSENPDASQLAVIEEVRVSSALHRGRARSVRLRMGNHLTLLKPNHVSGLFLSGVALAPPGGSATQ